MVLVACSERSLEKFCSERKGRNEAAADKTSRMKAWLNSLASGKIVIRACC